MNSISGLLPVFKPKGITSKDVSRNVLRIFGKKLKLGHVGTLDPMASGVLPLLFGEATKLQDYLLDSNKKYDFEITLGYLTDTLDAEGAVLDRCSYDHVKLADINSLLSDFCGLQLQAPPLYSAVKVNGKPLYKYARQGQSADIDIEKLTRQVEIFHLEILKFEGDKIFGVLECSKGTYVRSLVRDLCFKLKTLGTLTALSRTLSAGVDIKSAKNLDTDLNTEEKIVSAIIPIVDVSLGFPKFTNFSDLEISDLKQGKSVILNSERQREIYCLDHETMEDSGSIQRFLALDSRNFPFAIVDCSKKSDNSLELQVRRGINL
ncbi:MAG: tRNA pseudouridine(55) synthase TruB [Oligoflexales bacterium]|nr:tRNA pseudouridine(55) synthase TruB [Oligoflexales bacterium]